MSTTSRNAARDQRKKEFVEQLGINFEELGMPRMAGRVLGWLLICSPPHQRASDLERAVGGSKGSISTSVAVLLRFQLLERVGVPGERCSFYQVRSRSWTDLLELKMEKMTTFRVLAERGLELLADEPPEARQRLEEIRDLYSFFERELPALVARYRTLPEPKSRERK